MGRQVDQKLTICPKRTAGGQYGTPKVNKLCKKAAGGQYWTPKVDNQLNKKPPEANMGRQKLTNS